MPCAAAVALMTAPARSGDGLPASRAEARLDHPRRAAARSRRPADHHRCRGFPSTAGAGGFAGDVVPSRLEAELKARYPKQSIKVLNRGVNGEDAREMLERFDQNVIAENPDLVLWQVGTNALLLDRPLSSADDRIREGLRRLKAAGADVVLIDPQFAPKVLAKADIGRLMELYSVVAKQGNVGVFHRFAVMRHWREAANIPFNVFLSADELHMNDWSYGCIAKLMAGAVAEAAERATVTAQAAPRR